MSKFERPLLTFAVIGWNHERFVREGVEAAFSQTYSPLQIILSDDCSNDGTFDIMRQLAASYHGPHQIVLNRNSARRGVGGHFNKVVGLARGELIVVQAADDISEPQRVDVLFGAWERSGRKATSIHSDFTQIDADGRVIDKVFTNANRGSTDVLVPQLTAPSVFVRTSSPVLFGCTHAFSNCLFRVFGELPAQTVHEDDALAFRSVLLSGLAYLDVPLVKYRLHGSNLYLANRQPRTLTRAVIERDEIRARRNIKYRVAMYEGYEQDLQRAQHYQLIDEQERRRTALEIERLRTYHVLLGRFLDSGVLGKFSIFLKLRRSQADRASRFVVRRLMPRSLFLWTKLFRARVNQRRKASVPAGTQRAPSDTTSSSSR